MPLVLFNVVIAFLQQLLDDVFDVFTDITGFVKVVASAIVNETLSKRANVSANSVYRNR